MPLRACMCAQALSNQKLFETRKRFGPARAGLQTGDASLNTDAQVRQWGGGASPCTLLALSQRTHACACTRKC